MSKETCNCVLYGYEFYQNLIDLKRKLNEGKDSVYITIYSDNANHFINKIRDECDVNTDKSMEALYKVKEFIDKKQYLYAGDMLNRILMDTTTASAFQAFKKC